MSRKVDQTVSEDSTQEELYLDIWRTNNQENNLLPKHILLLFLVLRNNRILLELQYLPHPSQSNNLTQSSHSIFSSSNLSHTASPPSQLLIIMTKPVVTVEPVGFNVVN